MIGASTAVVCLGGILAACAGGGGRDGYVAAGPAGGTSGTAVAPTGDVTLVPLEGTQSPGSGVTPGSTGGAVPGDPVAPGTSATGTHAPGNGTPGSAGPSPRPATPGPTSTDSPSGTATDPRTTPAGPAALSVGEPVRQATDRRWCEEVTVSLHNTGGSAMRSGTVIFGSHVIGALGIDWATVESAEALPAPIDAGASVKKTWTVCVDAWRVPLGMHIETRDVSVQWK